jgi:RND family efflux transporter MFP subunit
MTSFHQSFDTASRRRWSFGLAFVLATAIVGLGSGCRQPSASTEKGPGKSEASTSEQAQRRVIQPLRKTVRRPIKRPGFNIEAYQSTALFAKISGYVGRWNKSSKGKPFDIGDRVSKGDVLVELAVPEMEVEVEVKDAAVAQARAEIKQALAAVERAEADHDYRKAQYDRLAQVGNTGVINKESVSEYRFALAAAKAALTKAGADVDVAKTRHKVAEKARDYAKTLLKYTKITAPFDGVITKRHINEEDFVQPPTSRKGEALFVVDQLDPVRVFVNIPEAEAVWVHDGDQAAIQTYDRRAGEFKGEVTRTARSLDPATRTLRTEIDLRNPGGKLLPGMYVDVTITPERRNVWTLPESAVVVTDDGAYCYRVEDGKAIRTPLLIGLTGSGLVEVLKKQVKPTKNSTQEAWQDITGEEHIVESGVSELQDGQAVRDVKAKE